MNTLLENLLNIISNPYIVLFGTVTLIEVVPVQIHPWKWLGNLILGDVRKDISELRTELTETKVQNWRWNVLDFANSCKNGRRHTIDEWKHAISQLAEYENYVERNDITNGVFEEDAKYLREEYHKHCQDHDFL